MGFFFRGKGKGVPANATFSLTQEGRAKLQDFGGDPKSQILMALETRGTSDVAEISETSGLSRSQVERFLGPLVRGNYIQYVSAMSAEGE